MQLLPRSPRAYLKPYHAQHHQHMPLPSMYQHHHIPSQDMCHNQVPRCTMHQHVPSTIYHNKCINHAPTPLPNHASTMHLNLYNMPQPSTIYTKYQTCTIPCIIPCVNHTHQLCTSTMYINTIPCANLVPYHVTTMHHKKCLNHISYHSIMPYTMYQYNQDMHQQCTSTDIPQPCA
jgi:hypothetical protein